MRYLALTIALIAAQGAGAQMVQQRIINGDFEDPVGGFTGWTTEGACAIVERDGDHCAQLSEPADGGRSRIYQVFRMPDFTWAKLTFRYRFLSGRKQVSGIFFAYSPTSECTPKRFLTPLSAPPFSAPVLWIASLVDSASGRF